MTIRRCEDAHAVATSAAAQVAELVRSRPNAVIYLPAGGTPIPLYQELAKMKLDWSGVRVVQLDELVGVPPSDARSFHAFLVRHWIEPLGFDPKNALLIDGSAPDPPAEIARHAQAALALGRPDLVLLGIGRNGHVAFNEPGTRLSDGARQVDLADATREALASAFAPGPSPRTGITLGLDELSRGVHTWLLATGSGKAETVRRLRSGPANSDHPASLLAERAGFELFADEAALSLVGC